MCCSPCAACCSGDAAKRPNPGGAAKAELWSCAALRDAPAATATVCTRACVIAASAGTVTAMVLHLFVGAALFVTGRWVLHNELTEHGVTPRTLQALRRLRYYSENKAGAVLISVALQSCGVLLAVVAVTGVL